MFECVFGCSVAWLRVCVFAWLFALFGSLCVCVFVCAVVWLCVCLFVCVLGCLLACLFVCLCE